MGLRLSLTSVGRLLAELDITPQKPLRRAYERDPGAIEAWKCAAYPALEQRARRCGADIFFLDEAGIRSDAPLQRTWGARGRTPVVATSGQRQSVNAISAVNRLGAFWYNVYSGRLNAAQSILFLKDFVRYRRRPVFLVVDRHPAHIAKIVAEHVQSLGGRLELHFLPGYAPDLNPDEFVWNHLRQKGISKTPLRQNESLRARVEADLAAIHADPPLVRFFFFSGSQCSLYYGLSSIGAWAIVGDPSDSDDGYFAGAVHLIPLPIDCNNNGVSDACDIATRASSDANADGVPDDCQPNSCPRGGCENLDIAGNDCVINLGDLGLLLANFNREGWDIAGDSDIDGDVDLADLGAMLAAWGADCNWQVAEEEAR